MFVFSWRLNAPEQLRKMDIKLFSATGSEHITYKWPLTCFSLDCCRRRHCNALKTGLGLNFGLNWSHRHRILLCLSSASASYRGASEGQIRHNAAWSLSQSEGSSRTETQHMFTQRPFSRLQVTWSYGMWHINHYFTTSHTQYVPSFTSCSVFRHTYSRVHQPHDSSSSKT